MMYSVSAYSASPAAVLSWSERLSTNCTWPGSERSTRCAVCPARVSAWPGVLPNPCGSSCAWTCHCTPVCAPGTAEAPDAPAAVEPAPACPITGRLRASVVANVASGMIAALAGRLRRSGSEQRVERLEDHVGRGDQRHARHGEAARPGAGAGGQGDGVPDPGLQGGGELLVEHDRVRAQRALQEAERVDVRKVAVGHRQNRAAARVRGAGGPGVRGRGERRGRCRGGLLDAGLPRHARRYAASVGVGADRALPVQRHAADRRAGHRPQRMTDEQQHRAQQRHRRGEHDHAHERPSGRAEQAGAGQPQSGPQPKRSSPVMRPSASPTAR